jgi:hypothetical protein
MMDFYLIASFVVNVVLFVMWKNGTVLNLSIKLVLLALSITGGINIVNTYHLIH